MNAASAETPAYLNPDLPLEERVTDLVSRLTIEEKIGMMASRQEAVPRLGVPEYHIGGEAAHGLVTKDGPATAFPQTIGLACGWDEKLLFRIGTVVGDEARAYYRRRRGLSGLTLWAPTVDMERDPRWGRTEEGYGEDPILTGRLSAAFIRGMQGDDPFYIKAAATPKHFYANNNEQDRMSCSASIDPRSRREYYLKAFERAFVEARAHSVMTAYNAVNGIPAMVHPDVAEVIKGEWAMDGFAVSDAGALTALVERHRAFPTFAEAAAAAVKAGIDNLTDETETVKNTVREALAKNLLSERDLDRAIGNVLRIRFRLGQFDPPERNPYARIGESVLWRKESRALAAEAARKAVVLLENRESGGRPALPLHEDTAGTLAVVGPLADAAYRDWYGGTPPYRVTPLQALSGRLPHDRVRFADGSDVVCIRTLDGRWVVTRSWFDRTLAAEEPSRPGGEQFRVTDWGWGNRTFKSLQNGLYLTTDDTVLAERSDEVWGWYVKERFELVPAGLPDAPEAVHIKTWIGDTVGLDANHGLVTATPENGVKPEPFLIETVHDGLSEAAEAARSSDTAIVFVGNHPLLVAKEEIDRPCLRLPPDQERLIEAVTEANPNTVVVIVGSYPFALGAWKDRVRAVLYTAHGGQEAGTAIAEVLFGDYNPAGRLPLTWYRSVRELPGIMEYDIRSAGTTYLHYRGTPLYPFGYGLSYSNYTYLSIETDRSEIDAESAVTVTVKIRNDGPLPGEEVVQLYVSHPGSAVKRPARRLVGFSRVPIGVHRTEEISFTVPGRELAFWDVRTGGWFLEAGECEIQAGASSADIRLTARLRVRGEPVPPRDPYRWMQAETYDLQERAALMAGRNGTVFAAPRGTAAGPDESGNVKSDPALLAFEDLEFGEGGPAALEFELEADEPGGEVALRIYDSARFEGAFRRVALGLVTAAAYSVRELPAGGLSGRRAVAIELRGAVRLGRFRFRQV
jgi:beta-glucosidase